MIVQEIVDAIENSFEVSIVAFRKILGKSLSISA